MQEFWCSWWFLKDYFECCYWFLSFIKQPWPVGAETAKTVGHGNWHRNTGPVRGWDTGASVQFMVLIGQFVVCFKAFLNSMCGLARHITLLMDRWEHCRRKRGCRPKDSQQKLHHNRMITVAQFACHLLLMLWLIELIEVSVKIRISIILDSIFHKLYFVLWALESSACILRKFREYGVWALLCLIKSNCMVPKLLFKHPKHVFHHVVIYGMLCFSQKHLNWNNTGFKQQSKLVVCVGQFGAAHKLLASKWLSAYRSIQTRL